MSISASLRHAAKLQEKIEALRGQLAVLLDRARAELDSTNPEEVSVSPRRGRRRNASKRVGRPERTLPVSPWRVAAGLKPAGRTKAKRRSPLAGRRRASSPSGPLAPAVVKILEQKSKPMNVHDILEQLLAGGYSFNTKEPKKNLAARIYRLKGVRQVSAGLFTKE